MDRRRWLLLALALLLAIPLSGSFELTSPRNVVGIVGQDTILPCTISSTKPLDNPEVQWRKITDGHPEDIYTYRHSGGEPVQKYRGRTSMPGDGFSTGNVSLTLKNVQPADEGMYSCTVTSRDWSAYTTTKLSIAGTGEVFLEILGPQGTGLKLGCRSHGWLPEPTVQWVTEDGQGLFADTEIHQDSRKLFSVWSRVTVTGEEVGKVTCQILNPLVQMEKKTTVRLSGAAFPRLSPFVPAFWTVLTVFLLTLAAGAVPVFQGRSLEANTPRAVESVLLKDLQQLSQQVQTLQEALQEGQESTQRDLELLRTEQQNAQDRTVEALESTRLKEHQELCQQIQSLQQALQNVQDCTQRDLKIFKTDLENQLGRSLEANTTRAVESVQLKDLQQLYQKMQALQKAFQKGQESTQCDLQIIRTDLGKKQDLSELRFYEVFVTLDASTAHPRLGISADGTRVMDTGVSRDLPRNEKRFDSHLFVLAKEGYTSGRHYWEVVVGRRSSWAVGVARESVTRKGPLTLCPKNGFWVIGLADGRDYWAYTDPWTYLSVSGKLQRVGIFLDIPAKQVTFYDVDRRDALFAFSTADGSSQKGKCIPFFSTCPATTNPDPEPLVIV
ncbi:butyrophilin subfamily 1 member A1-like [Myiozetetes cayanensis]|uniref:butyrophilin subfamily 1 member A1-like n=1 Tax=Myiozetetes cayanensis TaxID=478635 RepID=UPI00215F2A9A|nr:butyrophilin subfamily 1 member A1-like [Myiozetetes cayanensis]